MPIDEDIDELLAGSTLSIRALAKTVIACVRRRADLQPAVRWGWRSVNFRHPAAKHVCAVFPMKDEVLLVFEHGRLLSNESGLLEGDTRQVRTIHLRPGTPIPEDAIGLLLAEAVALRS